MSQIGIDLEERKTVIARGVGKLNIVRRGAGKVSAARKEMHRRSSRRRQPTLHTLTKYGKDMAMHPSKAWKAVAYTRGLINCFHLSTSQHNGENKWSFFVDYILRSLTCPIHLTTLSMRAGRMADELCITHIFQVMFSCH